REAQEVEPRLEHVVVQELAGKAVLAQEVLAVGERGPLLARRGEEKASASPVSAVPAQPGQQLAKPLVPLAVDLPDRGGFGPAPPRRRLGVRQEQAQRRRP